jgi:hypothetical protein
MNEPRSIEVCVWASRGDKIALKLRVNSEMMERYIGACNIQSVTDRVMTIAVVRVANRSSDTQRNKPRQPNLSR